MGFLRTLKGFIHIRYKSTGSMPQSSAFLLQPVTAAESGQKLLQFLTRRFAKAQGELPPSMVHRWVRTGQIRCNGKRCKAFQHVIEGDIIRLPPFVLAMFTQDGPFAAQDAATPHTAPSSLQFTTQQVPHGPTQVGLALPPLPLLIHESENLLVFNKMHGLPVHTGTGHRDSLATRLHIHYAGASFSPTPAHRLDKDTSGLLLVARSYTMLRFLQQAFADHRMGKEYLAWVDGLWPLDAPPQELCDTLIKQYIGAHAKMRSQPPASTSSVPQNSAPANSTPDNSTPESPDLSTLSEPTSTQARAIMHCVEHRDKCSLMHIRLLTGKTHQIRVQLASRGFPLCGDVKYGSKSRPPFKLHAMRLTLPPFDAPEDTSNTALCLECLPPWQGAWQVRHLPLPLADHTAP